MSHLGDLISALLDGELPGSERAAAKDHLAGCEECRAELAEAEAGRTALRSLPQLELPPGVIPGTSPGAAWWRRRPRLAWAASGVAAITVVAGIAFASGEPAPAFDMSTLSDQHTARVEVDRGISTIRAPGGGP